MELAIVNDQVLPLDQAPPALFDRGLYFGDGVYEVIAGHNHKLFAYQQHLQRFKNSLKKMDMADRVDLSQIEQHLHNALQQAQLSKPLVYFHVTRGSTQRTHDYHDQWTPNFLLTVTQRNHEKPLNAAAITHPDWRWKRCDIKSLNLLGNVLAKHAATKAGAYDALLVDDKGLITESSASSVLIVKNGALQTAPLTANILPGITRHILLKFATDIGLTPLERSFSLDELLHADEVFLTGTTTKVLAITSVDGQPIAKGQPGPHTAQLRKRLEELMND